MSVSLTKDVTTYRDSTSAATCAEMVSGSTTLTAPVKILTSVPKGWMFARTTSAASTRKGAMSVSVLQATKPTEIEPPVKILMSVVWGCAGELVRIFQAPTCAPALLAML